MVVFLLKIAGGIIAILILVYLLARLASKGWFRSYFEELTNINKDKEF